jgi:hypothetical protein
MRRAHLRGGGLAPPLRKGLLVIIHEGDDKAEAMEKALAEHIAAHPEDAGHTVKDFRWVVYGMVQRATAAEISEAEIIAAEERKARGEIEDLSLPRSLHTEAYPRTCFEIIGET